MNLKDERTCVFFRSIQYLPSNVVTGLQAGVFWFGRGVHPSQNPRL